MSRRENEAFDTYMGSLLATLNTPDYPVQRKAYANMLSWWIAESLRHGPRPAAPEGTHWVQTLEEGRESARQYACGIVKAIMLAEELTPVPNGGK